MKHFPFDTNLLTACVISMPVKKPELQVYNLYSKQYINFSYYIFYFFYFFIILFINFNYI